MSIVVASAIAPVQAAPLLASLTPGSYGPLPTSGGDITYVDPVVGYHGAGNPFVSFGAASSTLNSSAYTAPVVFSAQGTTTLAYQSADNADLTESSQSASFKIDSVAPSSAFTSHTSGQTVSGAISLAGNS